MSNSFKKWTALSKTNKILKNRNTNSYHYSELSEFCLFRFFFKKARVFSKEKKENRFYNTLMKCIILYKYHKLK